MDDHVDGFAARRVDQHQAHDSIYGIDVRHAAVQHNVGDQLQKRVARFARPAVFGWSQTVEGAAIRLRWQFGERAQQIAQLGEQYNVGGAVVEKEDLAMGAALMWKHFRCITYG